MNASPAMETGGPLICFDATATLRSPAGHAEVAVEDLFTGPGATVAPSDELLVAVDVPAPPPGTGSAYVRLEYRRQMEIAVVGATAVVTLDGGRCHRRPHRDHGARADDPARARRPRRRSSAATADAARSQRRPRPPRRPPTPISDVRASERLPPRDGRGDRAPRDRDALVRARGGDVPIPASAMGRVKVAATLHGQRDRATRSSSSRARACSPPCATSSG